MIMNDEDIILYSVPYEEGTRYTAIYKRMYQCSTWISNEMEEDLNSIDIDKYVKEKLIRQIVKKIFPGEVGKRVIGQVPKPLRKRFTYCFNILEFYPDQATQEEVKNAIGELAFLLGVMQRNAIHEEFKYLLPFWQKEVGLNFEGDEDGCI